MIKKLWIGLVMLVSSYASAMDGQSGTSGRIVHEASIPAESIERLPLVRVLNHNEFRQAVLAAKLRAKVVIDGQDLPVVKIDEQQGEIVVKLAE